MDDASTIQMLGAGGFGAVVGWYIYYINRYRTDRVQLSDIVTLIGAIGGAAILAIFPAKTDLFGAYGIGLAGGFFLYFCFLLMFVGASRPDFSWTWFLDGRKRDADGKIVVPEPGKGPRPMERDTTRDAP